MAVTKFLFVPLLTTALLGCAAPALAGKLQVYAELSGLSAFREHGQLQGFGVDTVREIQRRLGAETPIMPVPWARGYDSLQREPGVALFAATRTQERDPRFHWVGPISRVQWVFLALSGAGLNIRSLDDAKRVGRIGTYINDVREKFLKEQGFRNLESTVDNVSNFRKLAEGRVDLTVSTNVGMAETARQADVPLDDLEIVHVLREADLYIAISGGTNLRTVQAWQDAFDAMRRDGTFAAIYARWLPHLQPPLDVRRPWLKQ